MDDPVAINELSTGGIWVKACRGSLFVLLASCAWMQPFPAIFGLPLTPVEIVFPFVFGLWLLAVIARKGSIRWSTFSTIACLYFSTLVLSCAFSTSKADSFTKLLGEFELVSIAVIAVDVIRSGSDFKRAFYFWMAGSTVPIAIGLLSIAVFYVQPNCPLLAYTTYHHGAVPLGNFPRLSSTFVSASMFCDYLTVTGILLVLSRRMGWISAWLTLLGPCLVAVCSVFTVSIALGGVFVASGLWFWFSNRCRRPIFARLGWATAVLGGAAFLTVSFVALAPYPNAPYSVDVPLVGTTIYPSSRLLVWSETVRNIAADPLTGLGLGVPTSKVIFPNTDGTNSLLTDAHNTFLSVMAQNGILSLFAMILLCGNVLWMGFRRIDDPLSVGLATAFMAAFVYDGLTGSFEDTRHLWALMGMAAAASTLSRGVE